MEVEKAKNYIIEQAKYFLEAVGEFYPFGVIISLDGNVIPLGVQLDNDYPKPQEIIEILENDVIEKLKKREAIIAGVGIDVMYTPSNETIKKSAIQVRLLKNDGLSIDYFLPYRIENGNIVYENAFSQEGTLNFMKKN